MKPGEANVRPAEMADAAQVVTLMAAYYAEDRMPFDAERASNALRQLIEDASLGRVWVAESESGQVGYAALTLGFSLEYMGRDGFVDDLYVVPAWRGRGIGSALVKQLTVACVELGVQALHLEVGRKKTDARALYRRFGFEEHDRLLMTRVLTGAGD